MAYRSSRLPSRFPVGTKFVIEGRSAGDGEMKVFRRYLKFPDGTYLRLPARPDKRRAAEMARRIRHSRHSASEPAQRPSGQA